MLIPLKDPAIFFFKHFYLKIRISPIQQLLFPDFLFEEAQKEMSLYKLHIFHLIPNLFEYVNLEEKEL